MLTEPEYFIAHTCNPDGTCNQLHNDLMDGKEIDIEPVEKERAVRLMGTACKEAEKILSRVKSHVDSLTEKEIDNLSEELGIQS